MNNNNNSNVNTANQNANTQNKQQPKREKKLKFSNVSPDLLNTLPQDRVLQTKLKAMDDTQVYKYFDIYSNLYQSPNKVGFTLTEKIIKGLRFFLTFCIMYIVLLVIAFFSFSYFELPRFTMWYPIGILPFLCGLLCYFLIKRSNDMDLKLKLAKIYEHNRKIAEECYRDVTFSHLIQKTEGMGTIRNRLAELNDLIKHNKEEEDFLQEYEKKQAEKKAKKELEAQQASKAQNVNKFVNLLPKRKKRPKD